MIRTAAILALTVPFGPAARPTAEVEGRQWEPMTVAGLTVEVGPLKKEIGLGGVKASGPIRAYGGEGTVVVRQGLTRRDVDAKLRDVDAAAFLSALGGRVPELAAVKFDGRIPRLEMEIRGRKFTARLWWLGGVVEIEGTITGE